MGMGQPGMYGCKSLPAARACPLAHAPRPPRLPAQELLRAFALSRGWVGPSGLPDETRCSRRILKDYVDGGWEGCADRSGWWISKPHAPP